MLLNKVCRCSIIFLSNHFIIAFVILSKPGAFLVFKYLILSLICAIVIFLVSRVNWFSFKLLWKVLFCQDAVFLLESCSIYLNHSMMGGFDVQLTYYLNYPRIAKITDSRGKASNALASPITSSYIHKSTRMLG